MRLEPSDSVVATVVSAGQVIMQGPCIVQGIALNPAAASCTVLLIDPAGQGVTTTTAGTTKVQLAAAAAGSSACLGASGSGIAFSNGCIAVVAGAGATATIVFAKI